MVHQDTYIGLKHFFSSMAGGEKLGEKFGEISSDKIDDLGLIFLRNLIHIFEFHHCCHKSH